MSYRELPNSEEVDFSEQSDSDNDCMIGDIDPESDESSQALVSSFTNLNLNDHQTTSNETCVTDRSNEGNSPIERIVSRRPSQEYIERGVLPVIQEEVETVIRKEKRKNSEKENIPPEKYTKFDD